MFTSRSGQGRLAATRGGQERPGAPKGGQGRPGATRDGQSRPGAARGGQARYGQGRPKGGQEAHEAAKALQRDPKDSRWAAKRAQWGDHERPRGGQREAKGTQREPKGTQREPRGTQRAAKGRPRQQTHKKSVNFEIQGSKIIKNSKEIAVGLQRHLASKGLKSSKTRRNFMVLIENVENAP